MVNHKQKGQVRGGLSLLLIILGIAILIFAIGIGLYILVIKQAMNHDLKPSHISQNTGQTFEEYIKDAPSHAVNMYQQIQTIFQEDLPTLRPQDVRSTPSVTSVRFPIESDQLSKQYFKDEILPRFLEQQWNLENENDFIVYLRHPDYGHCTVYYPKATDANWMISCWKRHSSSSNKIPTKPE